MLHSICVCAAWLSRDAEATCNDANAHFRLRVGGNPCAQYLSLSACPSSFMNSLYVSTIRLVFRCVLSCGAAPRRPLPCPLAWTGPSRGGVPGPPTDSRTTALKSTAAVIPIIRCVIINFVQSAGRDARLDHLRLPSSSAAREVSRGARRTHRPPHVYTAFYGGADRRRPPRHVYLRGS